MSTDTGKAKLPALASVSTGNQALDKWMQAVTERLEVREGSRGNQYERVVTLRDLNALGLDPAVVTVNAAATSRGVPVQGVMVQTPSGSYARIPMDAFSDELRKTRLYRDLTAAINDAGRFDSLPLELRNLLLNSIADEATQRGADIQRLDKKVQSATESIAYTVQEVTAAVQGAQAGIRETAFAAATANSATAGKVTQLTAALDGTGSATIEQSLTVIADRTTGLRSQAMLKLNAGRAVAGVGLLASEDPTGETISSFMVQADNFSVTAAHTFASPSSTVPSATAVGQTWYQTDTNTSKRATATGTGSWATFTPKVPFGIDTATDTIYINGNVRIGSGSGYALNTIGLGQDGSDGAHGSVNLALSGYAAWNSAAARDAVLNATGRWPMIGDIVTEYDATHSFTYYASTNGYYATWVQLTAYINGNMLVSGTLTAGTASFNKAILTYTGYSNFSTLTVTNGYVDVSVATSGIGTPIFSWAIDSGSTDRLCTLNWVGDSGGMVTFRLSVWVMSTGSRYNGTINTLKIAIW